MPRAYDEHFAAGGNPPPNMPHNSHNPQNPGTGAGGAGFGTGGESTNNPITHTSAGGFGNINTAGKFRKVIKTAGTVYVDLRCPLDLRCPMQ